MPAPAVLRSADAEIVADFLAAASIAPTGLLLEGEAGIGKTTLWLAALEQARERGFRVMTAWASQTQSVLAYGSAADLVAEVDETAWAHLPSPQRSALNGLLSREDGVATNQGALVAGFASVINGLTADSPVLVAIDDLQWLDTSSKTIIEFVSRRLAGPVGVLATVRTDEGSGQSASWLRMPRPEAISRLGLRPLSLGLLQAVISERLGQTLSRPTMIRIHEISGGNPFYAIELARAMNDHDGDIDASLPGTLAELVRARIGNLEADVRDALLAVACSAAPTAELVGDAIDADRSRVGDLLATAERNGIVALEGYRVRFAHPLLAHGVYTNAPPAQRRKMHKKLAALIAEPELHARHLALASTSGDPDTLQSLDAGAQAARLRGAPAAAKELLELAFGLGGDTPERRIQLAGDHFGVGDTPSARALLEESIETMLPGPLRAVALSLLALVRAFDDSFTASAGLWQRALDDAGDILALRVPALVGLSQTLFNIGDLVAGIRIAEDAVSDAQHLGDPQLLSQAISILVVLRFIRGDGVDEASLQRALELENRVSESASPSAVGSQAIVRASMQKALLLAWTGQLDDAHQELLSMRQRCIDNGEEHELMFVAHMSIQVEIWRGAFAEAAAIADIGRERGMLPSGDIGLGATLTERAALAAFAGNEDQARQNATAGAAAFRRCGTITLADWPLSVLGFLDVSLGKYEAALTTLKPLLARFDEIPNGSEINVAEFLPDAIEAMIQLGRLDDAEPLVAMLERNGRRLHRPWMLAIGGRCRAMLLAAQGDIAAASAVAEAAMAAHERLPMPFERARTQLLVGQLHRRQRQPNAAAAALHDALAAFDGMGIPLWANRARDELARAEVARLGGTQLTPSEQRVAELAASGMTNRDVAAALFISPKTVESNLARIYRKLGIRSRAELGKRMSQPDA